MLLAKKTIISKENVFLNLDSLSKEDAIKLTGEKLVDRGYAKNNYIQAMLDREELMTTYMGMGVAIPHGVNEAKKEVKSSGIVILQFPNGVDFDGEKAYLLIGIAGKGNEHLEILSNLAVILDDELTEKFRYESDKEKFINTFGVNL